MVRTRHYRVDFTREEVEDLVRRAAIDAHTPVADRPEPSTVTVYIFEKDGSSVFARAVYEKPVTE